MSSNGDEVADQPSSAIATMIRCAASKIASYGDGSHHFILLHTLTEFIKRYKWRTVGLEEQYCRLVYASEPE